MIVTGLLIEHNCKIVISDSLRIIIHMTNKVHPFEITKSSLKYFDENLNYLSI